MNSCKIITIANQKGGTAKTTSTCNLGTALTKEGMRILLVDMDPQANLSMSVGIGHPDELEMPMHRILSKIMDGVKLPDKSEYIEQAMAAEKTRPRLKSLDDLFRLNDEINGEGAESQPVTMQVGKLTPFRWHPFHLYTGERLDSMVESIRKNCVLVPIIVRKVESVYEILSGHNRVDAAKLAGLDMVCCK